MWIITLILQILLLIILLIGSYILYISHKHRLYFLQRNVPYTGTGLFRFLQLIFGQLTPKDLELLLYQESKDTLKPYSGYTDFFSKPGVFITDLNHAKNIYVKDFDHFVNRRKFDKLQGDVLFHRMLITLADEPWKGTRSKLSPSFTTGKIRKMFQIFQRSSERMCDYMERRIGPSGKDYDIADIYAKYAMDAIASCVFGVDSKSFEYELGYSSEFEKMGQLFQFKVTLSAIVKMIVVTVAPKVGEVLGVNPIAVEPQTYFRRIVREVMKHRRETGERQEDFLQLMMDIQKGLLKVEGEGDDKEIQEVMTGGAEGKNWGAKEATKLEFDDDDIAANSTLFLLAGFDTLHSLLVWATYSLAVEQEMQKKLRKEVEETMEQNGGKLTYDGVHGMKYLDMFVNETLRLYSPFPRTERICTKDYKIPGTNAVIEKGTLVSLPILASHHDPEHFKNPEKFDPERFTPEEKAERHPYAFQSFGHGPRNCIGMRFALTEAKSVICELVRKFHLEPSRKTDIPPKFGNSNTLKPKNGMWLKLTPRL